MPILRLALFAAALACAAAPLPGLAQAQGHADLDGMARRFVERAAAQTAAFPDLPDLPLRLQVDVGRLDARLRLAPCTRVQPYLGAGARLWGRSRLGLRCTQGARWNVFLPVTVHAWGPGWVLRKPVPAGHVLRAEDAEMAEIDWAGQPQTVYARARDWVGQRAARPLPAGLALRHGMLRQPALVAAGSPVRVHLAGPGFAIAARGKALGSGAAQQGIRVRLDNGRLIRGSVAPDGSVQLLP